MGSQQMKKGYHARRRIGKGEGGLIYLGSFVSLRNRWLVDSCDKLVGD